MRVVVADRAVHLGERLHCGEAFARARQPRHHVGDFLAQRRRARRLAMRAGKHRLGGIGVRHLRELVDDAVERGQQHLAARRLQHQRVAGVVDVLAGAGEVDELARRAQFGLALAAVPEPVLDRLHVVVGRALDILDRLRIGLREAQHEAAQEAARGLGERPELVEAGVRQRDEPLDLDLHPPVHEAELRQQRAQRRDLVLVAPVQRRQGGECGGFHGTKREWRANRTRSGVRKVAGILGGQDGIESRQSPTATLGGNSMSQ